MEEQLRKKKQDELVKIGQQIQFESNVKHIGKIVTDSSNTTPIAYLSDPKNYQAIREKQALIERHKSLENKKNRIAMQGRHQM
jgi:hypothetical protein